MPSPDDTSLRSLLRQWSVQPRANPSFRAEVWQHIEAPRSEPQTFSAWFRLHAASLAAVALVSVLAAGSLGAWSAHQLDRKDREQQIARYLTSIDPHQQIADDTQP